MNETRVLYVEDEPFLARIVQESLQSRGFSVHLAVDGKQALVCFDAVQPHICVLDIMLPHKDGLSVAMEIKEKNPSIPIIFLTAKTQIEDLVKGFKAGGNDYLKKPFSMEELIVRIQNLLDITQQNQQDSARNNPKEAIELGKYTFYPKKYELVSGENLRKLSHRENQLLLLLTGHTENPVLRRDILNTVWGDDSFYNSRNLDVYISRIRDYLSGDPSIRIVTLKGVGYRFQMD